MIAPALLEGWVHQATVALLHGMRLAPVAILCPFLGGPLVPAVIRMAIAFGLGAAAWAAGGAAPVEWTDGVDLLFAAGRELALGTAIGLVAALPVEAARAGGRLADTLRGATLAELHVAPIRQRETALGDLLAQWAVVLGAWAGGDRLVVRAVLGTFAAIPVGRPFAAERLLAPGLRAAGELVACALLVAAPAAAGVLAADLAVAVACRAAPGLGVPAAAQPARAALGLAAIAAAASVVGGKLAATVALSAALVGNLGAGAR